MHNETELILTIAAGIGLAFLLGLLALRVRLPPLVGYLVAGVVIGPFTPGFVAHTGLAQQLAEIGVILLMFGVGIHFSPADLVAFRRITVPGALVQIGVAIGLGAGTARLWGWPWKEGLVFGLCLSVASTVVLLRTLEDRQMVDSSDGRIAIGWLVVEDLVTVLVLVILPVVAGSTGGGGASGATSPSSSSGIAWALGVTILKVALFVALMLVVGRRLVPWLLHRVSRTGSRELFTLSVLAVALGTAVGAAALFGVSFALGAFFAGMVVNSSELSHEAATESLPLRDAFAVLFFVAVGMLFDPAVLLRHPLQVLATVLIIVAGKASAAFAIVKVLGYGEATALTIAAALAQIGEFSFIVAALGTSLRLLPAEAQSLIVAGALISITLNPVLFAVAGRLVARKRAPEGAAVAPPVDESGPSSSSSLDAAFLAPLLAGHVIVVGSGRVGGRVTKMLAEAAVAQVVIDRDRQIVDGLRQRGLNVVHGEAARGSVLDLARVEHARLLVVAIPQPFDTRTIVEIALTRNRGLATIVRADSEAERDYLLGHGARVALIAESELALGMGREAIALATSPRSTSNG